MLLLVALGSHRGEKGYFYNNKHVNTTNWIVFAIFLDPQLIFIKKNIFHVAITTAIDELSSTTLIFPQMQKYSNALGKCHLIKEVQNKDI